MERIKLGYGDETIEVSIPQAKSISYLREKPMEEIKDIRGEFLKAITETCIGSPPLSELLEKEDQVTIVLSDITRYWMRQDLACQLLVEYLTDTIGIREENIAVLIALGTHRAQSEEENQKVVSEEVYRRVKVYNHDCLASDLVFAGVTSRGTRVMVHPLAVGRKVILIGGTVHHLMSGFGGGRKSILPGICGKSTILHNHLFCLDDKEPHSSSLIGMGVLEKNPVHEDMTEAAAFIKPVFGINLIVNQGKYVRILCGHWDLAWRESCRIVHNYFGIPIAEKRDIVIASCGGYPKDINLYQGIKTLLNGAQALKDGGALIFIAQCRDGGGAPDFFGWIESVRTKTLDADLRADFSIAGYIFYAGMEVINRAGKVLMLTELPRETTKDMGIEAYTDIQELLAQVDFSGKEVYIMEHGGSIVPYLT